MNKSPRMTHPLPHQDLKQVSKGSVVWSAGFWTLNSELVFSTAFVLHTSWWRDVHALAIILHICPRHSGENSGRKKCLEKHHEGILFVVMYSHISLVGICGARQHSLPLSFHRTKVILYQIHRTISCSHFLFSMETRKLITYNFYAGWSFLLFFS